MPTLPKRTKEEITDVESSETLRTLMIKAQAVSGKSYRTLQKESGVSLATLSQMLGGRLVSGHTELRQTTVVIRLCKALGIRLQARSQPFLMLKSLPSPLKVKKTSKRFTNPGNVE